MLTKLTPIETASEIIYQRHIIQKLRREMTYTRRPGLFCCCCRPGAGLFLLFAEGVRFFT